jgi:uncharacterized protein (TIGR00369 family)
MSTPDFEARCRTSFDKQPFMGTLGAQLTVVRPGEAIIELPFSVRLTQQHGFLHAGAVTTIIDTACGYAALSMMAEGAAVLTVEFKVNLMKPAAGSMFRATGKVLRSGKSLTVCSGVVEALNDNKWSTIAAMQATMMAVMDRPNLKD